MNYSAIILFFLVLFNTSIRSIAQPNNLLIKQADSLLEKAEFKKAYNLYNELIQKEPNNEKALRGRGFSQIKLGLLNEAKIDYQKAIEINPQCSNCFLNLAQIAASQNQLSKTEELVSKAIVADATNENAFLMRAELRETKKDYAGALRDFDKAIQLKPERAECYIQRAGLNQRAGYEALAKADFATAIEKEPENAAVYFSRANFFINQSNWSRALVDLNEAIKINPSNIDYHTYKGSVLYYLQEFELSIKSYTDAIVMDSSNYTAYLYRAMSWHKLENMDSCCFNYQLAQKFVPKSDTAEIKTIKLQLNELCDANQKSYYYQRGIAAYNLEDYNKAVLYYNEGLEKFPSSPLLISFRGNAYKAAGNIDLAISDYLNCAGHQSQFITDIKSNPEYKLDEKKALLYFSGSMASLYEALAECYSNKNEFERALIYADSSVNVIQAYSRVEEFKSIYSTCLNVRAVLYNEKNELIKAKADLIESCTISGLNPLPHTNLAITYCKMAFEKNNKIKELNFKIQSTSGISHFNMPSKTNKPIDTNLLQLALNECNKAIQLDDKLAFSYLIRAQVKQLLFLPDACLDAWQAEKLGITDASIQLGISCPK